MSVRGMALVSMNCGPHGGTRAGEFVGTDAPLTLRRVQWGRGVGMDWVVGQVPTSLSSLGRFSVAQSIPAIWSKNENARRWCGRRS